MSLGEKELSELFDGRMPFGFKQHTPDQSPLRRFLQLLLLEQVL
jgi:hypothetical protein